MVHISTMQCEDCKEIFPVDMDQDPPTKCPHCGEKTAYAKPLLEEKKQEFGGVIMLPGAEYYGEEFW